MAITLHDPVGNVAASLSTTLPVGASAQPGDLRIVRIAMSTSRTFGATPAGWAVSPEWIVGTARRIRYYVRVLQAGDTDAALVFGDTVNNTNHERTAITLRGRNTSQTAQQVADACYAGTTGSATVSASLAAPSVTAAGRGVLLTWHSITLGSNGQTATITKPAGTNTVEVIARTPDAGGYLAIVVSEQRTATDTAATGTRTATASQTGAWNAAALFVPEAASGQTVTAQGIASAGAVGTPAVAATPPGVTLYRNVLDDFDAAAISPSRWSPWDPTYVTQSGGQVHIVGVQDDWVSLHTIAERNVDGAPLGARVSTTTTAGFDHYVAHMYAADGPAGEGNEFYWLVRDGRLYLEQVVADAWTRPLDLAYDPAAHRYFALGVRAGQLEALWSTDGTAWTVAYSAPNPYSTTLFRWQHMVGSTGPAAGVPAQLDVDEWFYLSATVPSTEAAVRNGWGAPLASSDEFAGTVVDAALWGQYDGPGHDGNGLRSPAANVVAGGYLRITGDAAGTTGGLAHRLDMMHGRWEVRARMGNSRAPVAGETPYHPVLLTWPQEPPYDWPAGAEYDFLEVDNGAAEAGAFLHFPNHLPRRQEQAPAYPLDLTAWHNYAFEWDSTGVRGWIDGEPWFEFTADGIQNAPRPMHLCLQLDNYVGTTGIVPGYLDVEYARAYGIDPVAAPSVSAGADVAGATTGVQITLDGVEDANGAIVTSRVWTITAGPDRVGEQLSTQRRVAFTPTAGGAYTLEFASTNASGTGRDDVVVTATVSTTQVSPQGIATLEAFGTPSLARGTVVVGPGGIVSGQAFGTPSLALGAAPVSPQGIATGEALGGPTIVPGAVNVAPPGVATGQAVGTPTIVRGPVTVGPSGIATGQAFGTPNLAPGPVTLGPAGIASGQAFGATRVDRTVAPTGIATGQTFGTPSLARGTVVVGPSGIGSAEQVPGPWLGTGEVPVLPSGVVTGEAFGTATIVRGAVTLAPTGIASAAAVGVPTLEAFAFVEAPSIASAEQFGTASIARGTVVVAPTGIASAAAVGDPSVEPGPVALEPGGIVSAEGLGEPALAVGPVTLDPPGIASAAAVGAPTIVVGPVVIRPDGTVSGEAFGTPGVVRGAVTLGPGGIGSAEQLGVLTLAVGPVTLRPGGIVSGQAFGALQVHPGPVALAPTGIPTAEAFGSIDVGAVLRPGSIVGGAVGRPVIYRHPLGTPTGLTPSHRTPSSGLTATHPHPVSEASHA